MIKITTGAHLIVKEIEVDGVTEYHIKLNPKTEEALDQLVEQEDPYKFLCSEETQAKMNLKKKSDIILGDGSRIEFL